jgi:AbrB family looped-hinge helix DNA binding protein
MKTDTARIDKEGRVLIPIRFRKAYNLKPGSEVEFDTGNECIQFHPITKKCILCPTTENLITIDNVPLCPVCINKFKNL